MKAKVYIESSIPGYLVANPSRDIVQYAMQAATQEWWDNCQNHFDLYISSAVIQEATQGDAQAAQRRLEIINNLEILRATEETIKIAKDLLQKLNLPQKMIMDAIHVAIALENGINYLLTWNLKHLANAVIKRKVLLYCSKYDYQPLIICTPFELLEAWDNDR